MLAITSRSPRHHIQAVVGKGPTKKAHWRPRSNQRDTDKEANWSDGLTSEQQRGKLARARERGRVRDEEPIADF